MKTLMKGVIKFRKGYQANLTYNKNRYFIGNFNSELSARKAYLKKNIELLQEDLKKLENN